MKNIKLSDEVKTIKKVIEKLLRESREFSIFYEEGFETVIPNCGIKQYHNSNESIFNDGEMNYCYNNAHIVRNIVNTLADPDIGLNCIKIVPEDKAGHYVEVEPLTFEWIEEEPIWEYNSQIK